ncbi:MAG: radical SAM protein [Polyangiaceae bacterium]|nr:radical SAM protein [Polyangiaceae bacterium]
MTIALVYPPTCDPTAPYLAVPMLTGFLREAGVSVLPIDANVEAWDDLLTPTFLDAARDRIEARIAEIESARVAGHEAQVEYAALFGALADAHAAPRGILEAKAILRDPVAFYDADRYADAVATIESALRAISASYHPLVVDFTAYRTPFGLLTPDDTRKEATKERNPFFDYVVETLVPKVKASGARAIGISVCFPGQLQPAYAFAHQLRAALPGVHLTCGGPGITQMLIRLSGRSLARALGPFDSAVVYEGEHTLLSLVRALEQGDSLRNVPNVVVRDKLLGARWTPAHGMEDLSKLPSPDFEGLPLQRYLSPELVLPYDPTRGCYWGKCTFCHYGLAEVGTAKYRERPVGAMVEHLRGLRQRHGTRRFYFSQDSVAPKTLLKLSTALLDAKLDLRWATDLKPEKDLTPERAKVLADAGAIACALGVESGDDRVLALIDKGPPVAVVSDVIHNLAGAGVAAEAMCFTDFPTETRDEALRTLEFLDDHRDGLGVYIVGEFGLTHGSLVAQSPESFGLRETWQVRGDELGLGIFFEETNPSKSEEDREEIDDALADLSEGWLLRTYPWAGAVSTAHTLLYYDRFGPQVFRDLAARRPGRVLGGHALVRAARFDVARATNAAARDAGIWSHLVNEAREVSRERYAELAAGAPALRPSPRSFELLPGRAPRARKPGRRPDARPNAAHGRKLASPLKRS